MAIRARYDVAGAGRPANLALPVHTNGRRGVGVTGQVACRGDENGRVHRRGVLGDEAPVVGRGHVSLPTDLDTERIESIWERKGSVGTCHY